MAMGPYALCKFDLFLFQSGFYPLILAEQTKMKQSIYSEIFWTLHRPWKKFRCGHLVKTHVTFTLLLFYFQLWQWICYTVISSLHKSIQVPEVLIMSTCLLGLLLCYFPRLAYLLWITRPTMQKDRVLASKLWIWDLESWGLLSLVG